MWPAPRGDPVNLARVADVAASLQAAVEPSFGPLARASHDDDDAMCHDGEGERGGCAGVDGGVVPGSHRRAHRPRRATTRGQVRRRLAYHARDGRRGLEARRGGVRRWPPVVIVSSRTAPSSRPRGARSSSTRSPASPAATPGRLCSTRPSRASRSRYPRHSTAAGRRKIHSCAASPARRHPRRDSGGTKTTPSEPR